MRPILAGPPKPEPRAGARPARRLDRTFVAAPRNESDPPGVINTEEKIMQRLGLISALALSLVAAPGAATAQWRGQPVAPGVAPRPYVAPPPTHVAPVPRGHVAPGPRTYVAPGPRTYLAPGGYVRTYAPPSARVWVPGYWGLRGDTRIWVGGAWSYPPFAGWVWVTPRWAWSGYAWVWQEGYWSPPY
jgi:hypothetical protein